MGVTWILGIAANVKALSFLWYPYVVLNSLQGMFKFIISVFVCVRGLLLGISQFRYSRDMYALISHGNVSRNKEMITTRDKRASSELQSFESH